MKKYIVLVLVLLFAVQIFAQTADPRPPRTTWKKELDYFKNGTMTFTYKTFTSPTLADMTVHANGLEHKQLQVQQALANLSAELRALKNAAVNEIIIKYGL